MNEGVVCIALSFFYLHIFKMKKIVLIVNCLILSGSFFLSAESTKAKRFVHPGMLQNKADLELMKESISANKEPWKTAFENLKQATLLSFEAEPYTHVFSGAYGANDSGGNQFQESGIAAYNHALIWYVTGEKSHADKAVEIINAWSYRLWDFDGNNAKLLVGLFAPYYLNAAEILRYTDSGWQKKDIEQFSYQIQTVLYPTIKDFFTEANGNWDASMIYAMMCMGVFLDDQEMFNRAIERFYYGNGNGGITKYIYPTGQCQEVTRDWGHVQLGIGEFAKAAQIAWTQGVDFYSAADNRLALGFEYAAKFLLGNDVPVFGILSQQKKDEFRDIYESVYEHYEKVKGIAMPFTGQLIRKYTRPNSSAGVLTGLRVPEWAMKIENKRPLEITSKAKIPAACGALETANGNLPDAFVYIKPGKSIQKEIDKQSDSDTPKWIVLRKGVHTLKEPLRLKSNITLCGEGKETILTLSPTVEGTAISSYSNDIRNVTIRDLLLEGAVKTTVPFDPNYERSQRLYNTRSRGGISLLGDEEGQLQNIRLENITIQNCTKSGVCISGAKNIKITNCDFSDNGSSVVPGCGFHHNLSLSHVSDCEITNCRFDASLWGNGLSLLSGKNIIISGNEFARNKLSGIYCAESEDVRILDNLIEGNDGSGIFFECLKNGSFDTKIENNLIQLNGGKGISLQNSSAVFPENNLRDNRISPGLSGKHSMHPERQIEFVKKQIRNKKEPYLSAYKQLIHDADSIYNQPHHALVNFAVPGYYDKPEEHRNNSLAIQTDAFAAYCLALAYRLSDETKYGEKAICFLNAWADTNKTYSEHDGVLVMTYSGAGFLMGAELMSETDIWSGADKAVFSKWLTSVYKKAANEIRVHKNNWADWGRFGSLLTASLLNDEEEIAENLSLIKSDMFEKIASDGSMPEETRRGGNGIWYTYFSLAPMTASAWLVYNLTGEDLFHREKDGKSIKKALDYLFYYEQHPDEWVWYKNPGTGKNDIWPKDLFEAMGGIYKDEKFSAYAEKYRPVIYPKHHYAWVFTTLMPVTLDITGL